MSKIRVTIWNEFRHENLSRNHQYYHQETVDLYPKGFHQAIADGIRADDLDIRCAWLDQPEQGLGEEVVNNTDVMLWWGHMADEEVRDEIVKRVHSRVLDGMGLIVLHSGANSKIFGCLMGSSCTYRWRDIAERERFWNIAPSHPIAQGVGEHFELQNSEMYGEPFDIPDDGKVIFMSWFEGGDVFRSGVAFERGNGKIFYFSPGHETYPVFYDKNVLKIIGNAVRWAKPQIFAKHSRPKRAPLEDIPSRKPEAITSRIES
ncbi:MAG: ThuA domain-containing protein [Victivallales bacterium]